MRIFEFITNDEGAKCVLLGMAMLSLGPNLQAQEFPPTILMQPANQIIPVGGNATFTVAVSGTGPFVYQWIFNGSNLANNIILTVAGGGVGDGEAATNAILSNPSGIALDGLGDLLVADQADNRLRAVGTNGIITTIAGNGQAPGSGDGGLATNAGLMPVSASVDEYGNVFVADGVNNRIREVGTNGIILTVAGNGTANFSGDGGSATNASLNGPSGVAVDSMGNILVADTGNNRIRKIGTNGIITTVAGNGTATYSGDNGSATNASLNGPVGIAVDPMGNILVADSVNNVVREVGTNGIIKTLAGNGTATFAGDGGSATNASLNGPSGVATDAFGNVFVADSLNNLIRKISTNGIISTLAGSETPGFSGDGGAATNAELNNPFSIALDAGGNVFFADQNNSRIRKVATSGVITTVAGGGLGDGGAATSASLNPADVTVDAAGNLYIADAGNNRIRKVNTNGIITTLAGNGTAGYSGDSATATSASLNNPSGVALDALANLFIGDSGNNRIRKVSTNGIITTAAGNGVRGHSGDGGQAGNANLNGPVGVTLDRLGNLFIADQNNNRIRKVGTNNIISTVAGNGTVGFFGDGGPATNANLRNPNRVAVDTSGILYLSDEFNLRVRRVGTNGIIATWAGGGDIFPGDGGFATNSSFSDPSGAAVDSFGNLFIADSGNNCIREVSTNGLITTIAGNFVMGFSGDGAAATNASLNGPSGVALDNAGNLFFADSRNACIREVNFGGSPRLVLTNITSANDGNYQVIITGTYGSVTSSVVTLTVAQPPTITMQPHNIIVAAGSSASLSASASGTAPLYFQWQKNGVPLVDGGEISGSGSMNLVLNPASVNDVGSYQVVVTNAWGSSTSSVAILTLALIAITEQPASQFGLFGSDVTLSVGISGVGPFYYQWSLNGTNLPNTVATISTLAGGNVTGVNPGISTSLNSPSGVAIDAAGSFYIADSGNNRILKIGSSGFQTLAGNGNQGFSGDGGAATNASLDFPSGVAFDDAGNLFIADAGNNRIRKIGTNGIIITAAGNGNAAFSGDGGSATNASLYNPSGIAADASGNLFIADSWNSCVRKVSANGIISTYVGNGTAGHLVNGIVATNAQLGFPEGVAVDSAGNLFIADEVNDLVAEVGTNGIVRIVAGNGAEDYLGDGGSATNASLDGPSGVAVDSLDDLFIADSYNNCIRKVDTDGVITTFAGNGIAGYYGDGGPATNAWLYFPVGVSLDASGNLFIADSQNDRIREVGFNGSPNLFLGNVGVNNSGTYRVTVTNLYGSVTSQAATLVVGSSPQIVSFLSISNSFVFSFPTYLGRTFVVQSTRALEHANWQTVFSVFGDGQIHSVTNPIVGIQQSYFRLLIQ